VLECARWAPSAKEAQPWRFVVVRQALDRHRLAAAAFNHAHVRTAPVVIACCARIHSHVSGNGRPSHPLDLAAATESMILAAADVGLAASWITGFRESTVREILGIPGDIPVVALLAIGFADGIEELPARRSADECIAWERWVEEDASRGRV